MTCPFCQIDPERNRIIRNGDLVSVIFSNPRLMPGHLLVIPNRHVLKISDLDEREQKDLFKTVVAFQDKIIQKVASGCDILQNYRPFLNQNNIKVDHVHVHLQPRELYDELYKKCQSFETDVFKPADAKETERIHNLLAE